MNKHWQSINHKLSAAFLLANMASVMVEDASEEAKQHFGGFKFDMKRSINNARRGLDDYMSIIRQEADRQGKTMEFFKDFEQLEKIINNFLDD